MASVPALDSLDVFLTRREKPRTPHDDLATTIAGALSKLDDSARAIAPAWRTLNAHGGE
jgi:hypothetical protein